MAFDSAVRMTTKLWSEECRIADAQEGEVLKPKVPAYEFTGRTYFEHDSGNPYDGV